MRQWAPPLGAAVVGLLLMAACGGGEAEEPATPTTATATATPAEESPADGTSVTDQQVVVGFASPILAGQPDQQALLLGLQKGAEFYGWSVKPLDARLSTDTQVSNIDTFITEGVQGIVTFPLDAVAMEPAFERANNAGIPVVGFASEAPHINTKIDQLLFRCDPSYDAAAFIAELKPNAKTLIIGPPPVPPLLERARCFEEGAKKSGLDVLERQDDTQDVAASAQKVAADMLTKHPDVEAWWVTDDTQAEGVAAALRAAGKTIYSGDQDGVVLIAGCCGASLGADAVESGQLTAVYDNNSVFAGAAAIKALASVYVDGGSIEDMPKTIEVPWERVDFDTVGNYVPYEERDVSTYAQ